MIVVMAIGASEAEILGVKSQILAEGMSPYDHAGAERVVIAVVGEVGPKKQVLASRLAALPGVESVTPISRPFKLTSREFHPEDTVIRVLDAVIGDGSLTMMAGPCSVESRDQLLRDGRGGRRPRARPILRGGAFKPRTSPYAFQGLGRRGTPLPRGGARAHRAAGDHRGDGAEPGRHRRGVRRHPPDRRTQHAELLAAQRPSGRVARPVMLKRGFMATIEELPHGGRVHRRAPATRT